MSTQRSDEHRISCQSAGQLICSGTLLVGIFLTSCAGVGRAQSNVLGDALRGGTFTIDSRMRSETVEDESLAAEARALTWRTRLGFKSAPVQGFRVFAELENIHALSERYNSTANGRTRFPVVADPEGSEWNQAGISWDSSVREDGWGTQMVLGRQRINLDNQRFFGSVGWRQNEQSFDALMFTQSLSGASKLRYYYLSEVNRVFGNNHPNPLAAGFELHGHLVNASHGFSLGTLTGYGYWIENLDLPLSSTKTLGARFSGSKSLTDTYKVAYTAEYARQDDWRGGASAICAHYQLLELGLVRGDYSAKIAQEVLSGNGSSAFQTPFATLHAFNGWVDKFLITPERGLVDRFASVSGPIAKAQWQFAYHQFESDSRASSALSRRFGKEWDVSLSYAFTNNFSGLAKFARYQGGRDAIGSFANDTSKFWLSFDYRY